MKYHTKKKRIKIGSTAKQRKRNKELCKRYPFLIPRNVWDDKIIWERHRSVKKYSYTLAEDFPKGWWKAFGLMMCEELREELLKYHYLDKFRFVQIKEKFGGLRAYTGSVPRDSKVHDIIEKYSILSENICISCGKPDVPMTNDGWYSPLCYDCFRKGHIKYRRRIAMLRGENYEPLTEDEIRSRYEDIVCDEDPRMADTRSWISFSVDGDEKHTVDISETAERIRSKSKY